MQKQLRLRVHSFDTARRSEETIGIELPKPMMLEIDAGPVRGGAGA